MEGERERERIMEEKLRQNPRERLMKNTCFFHRDNPEERGRAASQLVTGTVDGAQSGRQMALVVWKRW